MLTAYYDLDKSPPTYDIVAFLSAVEQERIRRREDGGKIVFLPGTKDGFRNDKFWPYTIEGRQHMLDHVAIPMARMLPGFTVEMGHRQPAHAERGSIGYGQAMYGLAIQVAAMRDGIRPLRVSEASVIDPRLVTITLREAEHWPQRNSNIGEWLKAARTIRNSGYRVVVIRDEIQSDSEFGEVTYPLASRNLEARGCMYLSSVCNLFVNNGPAWFSMALDATVLMFKPTIEGVFHTCSAAYFRECGIPTGGQIPGAPNHQRIVWEDDTAENIIAAFEGLEI
jgi:hypothetical protein